MATIEVKETKKSSECKVCGEEIEPNTEKLVFQKFREYATAHLECINGLIPSTNNPETVMEKYTLTVIYIQRGERVNLKTAQFDLMLNGRQYPQSKATAITSQFGVNSNDIVKVIVSKDGEPIYEFENLDMEITKQDGEGTWNQIHQEQVNQK